MYCIFQSCITFAILISLSNCSVSAEKEKSLSIKKRKGGYLETGELPEKVIRVAYAVHRTVTASHSAECFLAG